MSEKVYIIDVESGNLQSLANAIKYIGSYEVVFIRDREDFEKHNDQITKLFFPGVGNFGHFVHELSARGLNTHIKSYIDSGREIMGICVGLQSFMNSSEESPNVPGLGLLDFELTKFDNHDSLYQSKGLVKAVPHIGWNRNEKIFDGPRELSSTEALYNTNTEDSYYFVHSYAAILSNDNVRAKIEKAKKEGWSFAIAKYGSEEFIACASYKNLFATQFHPEKSGEAGLSIIKAFLDGERHSSRSQSLTANSSGLTRRIIACLDVRSNDAGDLVVTKGDQYDVREKSDDGANEVRNLGKPVELATKYYRQGADEVTFLNITSFRESPIKDLPMLEVLRKAAEKIFVPLTVGGGIKDLVDPVSGELYPAVTVADLYFRSGADKVSIGSDAVRIAEEYYASNKSKSGKSAIEAISARFGVQAVVISVDPKRKYLNDPSQTNMAVIEISDPEKYGPNGEKFCYYQVTSQGGRKTHELGALELCQACEALGAGEILLNSIDHDGTNQGFNFELLKQVKGAVSIPVIASSGAGVPLHFKDVFELDCGVDAALGAGMFHRGDYDIASVKDYLRENSDINVR
ncbi:hypothetical protein PUMCH_003959 [Australozyma saopauloensis]|uniref:Imidazole glycerol phosphate synthase hisHF n=1 Tax=Australozyma saopauloensis TaxID=291208 RepID=A0AAX4HDW0_9ASCO|nr:hypothetical protein PUMCH_003959 [[Candida] saopauloensis]